MDMKNPPLPENITAFKLMGQSQHVSKFMKMKLVELCFRCNPHKLLVEGNSHGKL